MTTIADIKQRVAQLIAERNLNPNSLSIQIGYERTYLSQFINKPNPQRLGEKARRNLAALLHVPEQELTDESIVAHRAENITPDFTQMIEDVVEIDMLDVTACCGSGKDVLDESVIGKWLLPLSDFRHLTFSCAENIKMIKVVGSSMEPTLKDGDWVFVDITQNNIDMDGIFLLRMSTGLAVKRIQAGMGDNIIIISDNPKYQSLNSTIEEADIIGKVIHAFKSEKVG